jgi:hypothetical protein
MLGSALKDLREEMQPLQQAGRVLLNTVGTIGVQVGRAVVLLVRAVTFFSGIEAILNAWDDWFNQGKHEQNPFIERLRAKMQFPQGWLGPAGGGPRNRRPEV